MIAILHNIRSMHNVGSIFRTADAAGIEKLYLCGITPTPMDQFGKIRPQLAKVSLGAEKTVAWEKCGSTSPPQATLRLIDKLKNPSAGGGYKIFAVEQSKNSTPYYKATLTRQSRVALIVGNEVKGLPPAILKKCDKILEIPMRGKMVRQAHHPKNKNPEPGRGKESLNVAVAFGIVAFRLIEK